MLLRLLRRFNRGYAFGVFAIYLVAFGIAFLFIFIFPPATLALLFVSIFGLLVVQGLGFILRAVERRWNRKRLVQGRCPACGAAALAAMPDAPGAVRCGACDARHDASGCWLPGDAPQTTPTQA